MRADATGELAAAAQALRAARRPVRLAMVCVFLLSAAIRLILAAASTPVLVSDARDYHVLARNLAAGYGYVQEYHGETEAFNGFTFRAFRSPGYPVLLAALYSTFGWHPSIYLAVNIVSELVTQACFLLIAARLFGAGAALFVQILLAIHVLWTVNPMTESLHTALLALLALLLVGGRPLTTWSGAAGFGLLAAAALFVRPISLCVFPALTWRWLRERPSGRSTLFLLVAALPSLLGLSAWALRNHALFGEPVWFTTNLGHHNAWDFGLHADRAFAYFRAQGLNEAQINDALVGQERTLAAADPSWWLGLCLRRAAALFSLAPAWEVENVLWKLIFPMGADGSLIGRLYRASYAQYYVTYALAAAGAAVWTLQRRSLGGLWSLLLAFVLLHAVVSRGDMRLLAPVYPVLCLLVAGLWETAATCCRGRRRVNGHGRST